MLQNQLSLKCRFDLILHFLNTNIKYVKLFFVVFYVGGFLGILLPISHSLFTKLIPYALLLSFITTLFYQSASVNRKMGLILGSIFLSGFCIEVIGVNTGLIFGFYHYGEGLGVKFFNTPVIIGLNWAFLVYFTFSLCNQLKRSGLLSILLPSLLMLGYDLILEQSAPMMDMWYWKGDRIPLQNYFAWFCVAVLFQILMKYARLEISNKFSGFIFSCQFIFFALLYLTKGLIL